MPVCWQPVRTMMESSMAVGWTGDSAVSDQIRDSVEDEVLRIRAAMPKGESAFFCEECGEPIPERRRNALPGIRLCIACQEEADRQYRMIAPYNRKGSKDSQLR